MRRTTFDRLSLATLVVLPLLAGCSGTVAGYSMPWKTEKTTVGSQAAMTSCGGHRVHVSSDAAAICDVEVALTAGELGVARTILREVRQRHPLGSDEYEALTAAAQEIAMLHGEIAEAASLGRELDASLGNPRRVPDRFRDILTVSRALNDTALPLNSRFSVRFNLVRAGIGQD